MTPPRRGPRFALSRCAGRVASRHHFFQPPDWRRLMDMAEMAHLDIANPYKKQYGNYIGGEWVAPIDGQYFDNLTPVTGQAFTSIPRSNAKDIEAALDAAHKAKAAWG